MREPSLREQRQALRLRLQAQRQVIARQLAPNNAEASAGYPRSRTMRLLMRRPALVGGVVAEVTALVFGARLLRLVRALRPR